MTRIRSYVPGDSVQCTYCKRSLAVTQSITVPKHGDCPAGGLTLKGEASIKEPPPDVLVLTRRALATLRKILQGDTGITPGEWAEVAINADDIMERARGLANHAREREEAARTANAR